jgi:hypothetical protein
MSTSDAHNPHPGLKPESRGERITLHVSQLMSLIGVIVAAWLFLRLVVRYSVDVPFYDDWVSANLLDRQDRGVLAWRDLWKSNNEHRVPVPLLTMLIIGRLTRMNLRAQMGVSMLAIFGICGLAMLAARDLARRFGVSALPCHGLIAALVLTRAQWNNVLWGWQITLTFGAAFGFATLLFLAPVGNVSGVSWKRWLLGILTAFLCQYSFASGLLIWPLGLFLIALRSGHHRWLKATGWAAAGVTSTAVYIHGLVRAGGTGGAGAIDSIDYSLTQLGSSFALRVWECAGGGTTRCGPIHREPLIAGAIGVVALALVCLWLLRLRLFTVSSAIVAWGMWAILSALLISVGRASLGTEQALASRYVTLAMPLWASIALLIPLLIQRSIANWGLAREAASPGSANPWRSDADLTPSRTRQIVALTLVSAVVSVAAIQRTGNSEYAARGYESGLLSSRGFLRTSSPTDDQLRPLFIDVREIRRLLPTMERQKISVFREPPP